jgi:DNA mismatch repair protein MutS
MMRQYKEHKAKHPDAILLFRMGDFYEMFYDDAVRASKILDIALTTRDRNKESQAPMCGFPHHSASQYISKLLLAGERVAVCDQMEDPRQAKGIVKREVTRVLTPGLTEESDTLDPSKNNYLVCVSVCEDSIGIGAFDLSTGDLRGAETSDVSLAVEEVKRLEPREILTQNSLSREHPIYRALTGHFHLNEAQDSHCDPEICFETLTELFRAQSLEGFGIKSHSPITLSLGIIISYVKSMRMAAPQHVQPPKVYHLGNYMVLDTNARRNLEIFQNIKDNSTTGSLMGVIDRTLTSMGARLLRQWVSYPLLDPDEINYRSESVEGLVKNSGPRENIRDELKEISDMERIAARISLMSVTPRDLVALRRSIELIPDIVAYLKDIPGRLISGIREMDDLSYIAHALGAALVDSPPAGLKDGGAIREGYNEELDELRSIRISGKEWIARIEAQERERTGIPKLKVGYNKVFGYYLEITKAYQDKIPQDYIRKQTLVNAERYITEELKNYELKILNAQERIVELETEIFGKLRESLLEVLNRIQDTSAFLARLDVLQSLAEAAASLNYVRPRVHEGDEIVIREGRHPVVETVDQREPYTPNDATLNNETDQILIITGPNMAGKSTYLRQTALIALMAQMGSFVPASEATIGIVDRIFTRIGAADYLAYGQSTFMVEMIETAEILHNATERSLVLLDEVGRGTSTFDGLSIAWAVTERLHDRPEKGPRTFFATHYHELVELARTKSRIVNYSISAREWEDTVVFLRKIVPGGAGRSFGIQVAQLAGVPAPVINRAKEILANLESEKIDPSGSLNRAAPNPKKSRAPQSPCQMELFSPPEKELLEELKGLDPNNMTPLEALKAILDWKQKYN